MSVIDSIQLSGTVYTIEDSNANKTVSLTQAQYDALSTKDPNTYYIITDAEAGDLTNYYTKTEVDNAITAGTSTKQDTLVSGTNIKTINNESILGSGNINIQGGGGGTTYTAGHAIDLTNDVISMSLPISAGTGTNSIIIGGTNCVASGVQSMASGINTKAIGHYSYAEGNSTTALTNYSHAEGRETKAGDYEGGDNHAQHAEGRETKAQGAYSHAEGYSTSATSQSSHAEGRNTKADSEAAHAEGFATIAKGQFSHVEGYISSATSLASHAEGLGTLANASYSHTEGQYTKALNQSEHASGRYNNSVSASTTFGDGGNTLFSVGNGTADNARHNAFEIRQNGDIYITSGGTDIKLQDNLGGGGGGGSITIDPSLDSGSPNAVANSAITTAINSKLDATAYTPTVVDNTISSSSTNPVQNAVIYQQFGGLKLQQITQSAYDALATKDSNTLYVIVN